MAKARVVVVGSSNTDLTMLCSELPGRGQTVLGGDIYSAGGGKGANQAVAAARAGAQVWMVGAVGDDDFGKSAIQSLKREKIDTRYVSVKKGKSSGVAMIMVDEKNGDNLIGVSSGANAQLAPADIARAASAISRASLLLLQLEVPVPAAAKAAEIARKAGVPVLLNPAPMPAHPLPREFLASIDYLVPNQGELVRMAGKASERMAAERLFRAGMKALVVTLGSKGARVITPEGISPVPGFRVRAVDTVGAGDCFCGYLAAGLGEGRSLEDASLLASAAAAVSVTRRGAQPAIPRRAEADRLARTAANRRNHKRR